jgi:hypothetical protein
MRYDVVVFGSLLFRRGRSKAWRRHLVDSRDYKVIARVFPKKKHLPPEPVSSVLYEMPRATGRDLFQCDEDNGLVNIRALFTDAAFDARCRQLAALFMCAVEHGAEGHVCFLGEGVPLGYGITVGDGEVELIKLDEQQITNASLDPALDAVSDYFKAAEPGEPEAATSAPAVVPTLHKPKRTLLKLPRGAGA